ncbi:MAG: hypothetical protein DMG81_12560 [Acidobacteria bacterium]|nr:MAG: hypothetical protein DMG81_12560 [Acidobacteriota bacterium]
MIGTPEQAAEKALQMPKSEPPALKRRTNFHSGTTKVVPFPIRAPSALFPSPRRQCPDTHKSKTASFSVR